MRIRRLLAIVVLTTTLLGPGCWDRVELEDIAWVQAIGFDKGPPGFYSTTMEIGIPRSLRGGVVSVGAIGPRYTTVTVLARSILEAIDLTAVNLGRRISLVQAQLYLFGREFAETDVRSIVGETKRLVEARGSALVAMAQGRAEDILRVNTSPLEVSPGRFLMTILQQHGRTGLFEAARFVPDFVNLLESSSSSPRCPILALASDYKPKGGGAGQGGGAEGDPSQQFPSTPQVGERVEPRTDLSKLAPSQSTTDLPPEDIPLAGGGPVILAGTAMFQGGRMVGTLTGEESRAVLVARNDLERAAFPVIDPTAPDKPELALDVEITGPRSKVRVTRTGDQVRIRLDIHVTVSYLATWTQTDFSDPRMTPLAESAIEDYLKHLLDRTIAKSQAAGSDVFRFGERVKRTFLTWPEFEEFAWLTKYPTAQIDTSVKVHIELYGLTLQPPVIPPSEKIQSPK